MSQVKLEEACGGTEGALRGEGCGEAPTSEVLPHCVLPDRLECTEVGWGGPNP